MLPGEYTDTIAAPATAPGTGAVGITRISGNKAFDIIDRLFQGKRISRQPSHTLHYGTLKFGEKILDDVIVSIFRGPNSYTKEDVIEISSHGSPFVMQKILEALLASGARLAKPGEFTLRAFLNGRFDLAQAEAVADLIASGNAGQHDLAISQLRGGFSAEIKRLRQELIDFAALIELELDFGEEDVEFANRERLESLIGQLQTLITGLLDSFKLGNAIKQGVVTVLVGRPNAGKSTLLNALLNEERAIVSPIAGTTRDTVEEILQIEGIGFRLVDTAGIREAGDEIEAIGIRRTMEKVAQGAIIVYLFDPQETSAAEVMADLATLKRKDVPLILACNKIDSVQGLPIAAPDEPDVHFLPISAKTGQGIPQLKRLLFELATGNMQQGDVVVANARHYEALSGANAALSEVLAGLRSGLTGDLLSHELRQALYYLGLITGEVSNEDILDSIFSKFCIGK